MFSDDPRPNTYVSKVQADAICKMAVDAAADPDGVVSHSILCKAAETDGVVCQSICDFVADKYNLGGYKIAYGFTAIGSSSYCTLDYSSAGFTSPPIVVYSIYRTYGAQTNAPVTWVSSVSNTSASLYVPSNSGYQGAYWMAIGT